MPSTRTGRRKGFVKHKKRMKKGMKRCLKIIKRKNYFPSYVFLLQSLSPSCLYFNISRNCYTTENKYKNILKIQFTSNLFAATTTTRRLVLPKLQYLTQPCCLQVKFLNKDKKGTFLLNSYLVCASGIVGLQIDLHKTFVVAITVKSVPV